jgi:hypothetical protein
MDISKIEDLINKRINKDFQLKYEIEEEEKKTISYLYKSIISNLRDEINKSILTYNSLLEKYKSPLQIFLYSGNHFSVDNFDEKKIVIIFRNNKSEHPNSQTLITNFNHCIICFERFDGIEDNFYFFGQYCINISHAIYEKRNLKLSVNEEDKNKIKSELLEFFNLFIEASIEKCCDLKFI